MRSRLIARYMAANPVAKVGIGMGGQRRDGWLSTDYAPPARDIVFLDATKPFPFAADSIDYFVSEDMIEHVPLPDGLFMLKECLRTLKPGGVIRIATPDVAKYQSFIGGPVGEDARRYIDWSNTTFGDDFEKSFNDTGVIAFNRAVREWGHTFMYDAATLVDILKRAGFTDITARGVGESDHDVLRNMETRAAGDEEFAFKFETMVFEARKPAR